MKKKTISIFLFMLLMFFFSTTVSATSISANDIESRTYIIGEHMYTRETNGDYTGRLTTQYIMLGASTINSDDINQMIIYYKNPLGEWKNALNNQTITVPETFDIKYTNGEQIDKTQYGDVDCDGTINTKDLVLISRYVAGYEDEEVVEIINGDVNGDGKVTETDVVLLTKYISGNYTEANLPEEPLGKSYIIEYVIGDASSQETYKIDYELEGQILWDNQKPENPEKKGYIFDDWYTDETYTTQFEFDKTTITQDITLYAKFIKPQYGDINCDGTINGKDVTQLMRYLAGWEMPENVEIINGDVNGDGKVTNADETLLMKYIAGYYPEANLPEEPLGKTYVIEYVIDNTSDFETYKIDYELEGQTLVAPEEPEKEGYIFKGWYTDIDFTIEFEFGKTTMTENIILYAKFIKPQYGDVNCDGIINGEDVTCIRRYLDGYEMPEEVDMTNGDVNGDGKITEADVVLLRKYNGGYYPKANLPEEPLGKTYYIEYAIDNTSDFETYVMDYELEGQILSINHRPENPEKEGYIFDGWYTWPEYTTEYKFEYDKTTITTDLVLYGRFVKCGDVDLNGEVNIADVTCIRRYTSLNELPTTGNISYGDVNEDGEVDDVDAEILQKYLSGTIDKLPYDSGEKYTITYNLDGGTDADNYNIKTYAQISLPYKLNTPTKEGYTFIGWTGSNGTTPQTEVTIEEGTTGNLEYTANWELNN